jgi:hypothetical protein
MRPRTLVLVMFGILTASVLIRIVVFRYGLLPVTMEAVLKKAVAIEVYYYVGSANLGDPGFKPLLINDRAEVERLLSVLHTVDLSHGSRGNGYHPGNAMAGVSFVMPNGTQYGFNRGGEYYASRAALVGGGSSGNGVQLEVDPAFFYMLSEIVSRHEGRRIELASDSYK